MKANMKQVRFTYHRKNDKGNTFPCDMMALEISTDGGKSWDFSRGYSIRDDGAADFVNIEAITELQRCISLGYIFVIK